jgi:NADH:ubiquinone oxidoreductase subunit 5 (subunit L)/multisubunit Na+/H+ antiporter MnhA subunit
VLSVIGGYLPIKSLISEAHAGHLAHEGSHQIALLSIGLGVSGFLFSFLLYFHKKSTADEFKGPLAAVKTLFLKKYFFDDFYDTVIIKGIQENLAKFFDLFERYVVVEGGVNGTAKNTRSFGDLLRKFQTGVVQSYVFIFVAGLIAILVYYLVIL